jgi:capsular polysaccharide transport system permease protein
LDGGETHGMPTFVFMAHGMVIIQLFLTLFNASMMSVKKAAPLYAFRQVQPISPLIASSLFELLVKVFVLLGIGVLMYLLSIEVRVDNQVSFMFNFFIVTVFTASIGFLVSQLYTYQKYKS